MIADPMKKSLIIVESPTKAKTIGKYLPSTCTVMASAGHVVDLNPAPDNKKPGVYGVDTENGFALDYEIVAGKEKLLADLKKELKKAEQLILASDEDREGESIAWHLYNQLQPKVPVYRMVFHEITKKAITAAFDNCRDIDMNLVMAQEARRAIDRLQGYGISPILSQKLGYKYSAGRVQSPALKLIVEKEKVRRAFLSSEYCSGDALLSSSTSSFAATLTHVGKEQVAVSKSFDSDTGRVKRGIKVLEEKEAEEIASSIIGKDATVLSVNQMDKVEHPSMPFTTSTLQQDATRKLGKSAKEIMSIAQRLYENGFITYMRTDSPTLSTECIHAASEYIVAKYGESWLQTRNYKAKSAGAQEAHEAIRPAGDRFREPQETGLKGDELKLYSLIWKRTIATQMRDSIKAVTSVKLQSGDYTFAASGSVIKYEGFRKVYMVSSDTQEDEEGILPALEEGSVVSFTQAEAKSHTTQPPQRYTEASLVQKLESEEIGRPSTSATIISTLLDRGYIVRQGQTLVPTFTGFFVDSFLEKAFSLYVGYDFTKNMEAGLDSIARGEEDKVKYLSNFWYGGEGSDIVLPGLANDIQGVKKTVKTGDAKNLLLPGLTYTFVHGDEEVHYEIKTGKFGPYILSDKKEGENQKDMMRSIPDT
ncbi:MAG: type I DNA topoisomerase, partial [Spirochaetales bacterium]|nr:type I DNA topoisomerase [Candidatus Physcosoma equi]